MEENMNCKICGSENVIITYDGIIRDGYNGFLVPVNNYHELANRMNEIANNSKLNFSGHAEDLRKQYSVEKITNDWITFIKNLEREVYE